MQRARRTLEYRLMGGGTAEFTQPAGGLARGVAGSDRATRGKGDLRREGGGVRVLSRRQSGPVPTFFRLESPSAPRRARDGLGSLNGLKAKSREKREAGGAAGPNIAVRM
jgi:hypothetical protein